jgi:prevent-host-death family protein
MEDNRGTVDQLDQLMKQAHNFEGEVMNVNSEQKPLAVETSNESQPLPFGQNLLGVTFLSDHWEEDIPLEYFQDEDKENPFGGGGAMASTQVNLYEAKTNLSSLVDRAAKGEEVVIAKAGKPMARLVALRPQLKSPRESGKNLMGITYIADDFDAPLPEDVLKDFGL